MEGAILTAILDRLGDALASPPFDPSAPAPRIPWPQRAKDLRHGMHPLRVDGASVGYVDAARAVRLARFADVFRVRDGTIEFAASLDGADSRSAATAEVACTLAAEGALTSWRDELYTVAETFGASPAFLIERAAARYFGVSTWAAHVNGVVVAPDGTQMWLARRSATKPIDPGQLDNLVGGGIAAGERVADAVVREAWEEAGIDAALAATACPAGSLYVERLHADGLQRETIFVHDLALPAHFVPANQDGEVVEHRLVTLDTAACLIAARAGPDLVTIDASLVVLDYLRRSGALDEPTRG